MDIETFLQDEIFKKTELEIGGLKFKPSIKGWYRIKIVGDILSHIANENVFLAAQFEQFKEEMKKTKNREPTANEVALFFFNPIWESASPGLEDLAVIGGIDNETFLEAAKDGYDNETLGRNLKKYYDAINTEADILEMMWVVYRVFQSAVDSKQLPSAFLLQEIADKIQGEVKTSKKSKK